MESGSALQLPARYPQLPAVLIGWTGTLIRDIGQGTSKLTFSQLSSMVYNCQHKLRSIFKTPHLCMGPLYVH